MQVARIGDLGVGVCCCHCPACCISMAGTVVTGSGDDITDNSPTARLSDIVIGFCGHLATIVTGSSTVFTDNLNEARVGDTFVGCFTGTIVSGSPTTSDDGQ